MLRAMDPFGATSDPRLYVPRLGTEAALKALRDAVAAGRTVSVLSGPPGLGKTLVLRVLAEQLRGAQCAYVPVPSLGIEELAQVALDAFGEPAAGARATVALADFARRAPGAPAVLLVDDASAMPVPTARAMREIADALGGALRVVAAAVDDARSAAVIAALGDGVLHVRLRHALTPSEVRAYVRGRFERAGHQAAALALREEHLDWLAAESAGVPRELNTLLAWMQRAEAEQPVRDRLERSIAERGMGDGPEQLTLWEGVGDETAAADALRADARGAGGRATGPGVEAPRAAQAGAPETPVRPPGDAPARALVAAAADPGKEATPSDGSSAPGAAAPDLGQPPPPPPRRRRRLRRTRGWY